MGAARGPRKFEARANLYKTVDIPIFDIPPKAMPAINRRKYWKMPKSVDSRLLKIAERSGVGIANIIIFVKPWGAPMKKAEQVRLAVELACCTKKEAVVAAEICRGIYGGVTFGIDKIPVFHSEGLFIEYYYSTVFPDAKAR